MKRVFTQALLCTPLAAAAGDLMAASNGLDTVSPGLGTLGSWWASGLQWLAGWI